jgi:hypothetical protein
VRVVQPSGRQRHSHKFTVYLTAEELEQLDAMTAHIKYRLGIRADRGRIVRAALALVYRDLHRGGRDSGLVRGLLGDQEAAS